MRTDSASNTPHSALRTPNSLDPDNRLLWRFNRRRLEAEEIRDAMLAVSGRLNPQPGGPSVMVPVEQELVQLLYNPAQWEVANDARQHDRRSIYLIAKRNLRLPFMEVFDQPDLQTSCSRRISSTHAPQALELLNGTLANDLAGAFAERLLREAGTSPGEQIELAFRLAAGRRARSAGARLVAGVPLSAIAARVRLGDVQSERLFVRAMMQVQGGASDSRQERRVVELHSCQRIGEWQSSTGTKAWRHGSRRPLRAVPRLTPFVTATSLRGLSLCGDASC